MCETRVVNKYKESYDVYIGRGSIWGNPYTSKKGKTKASYVVDTREEAIELYRQYILKDATLLNKLDELNGKKLGCFCKPKACHGDVLLELLELKKKSELFDYYGNKID